MRNILTILLFLATISAPQQAYAQFIQSNFEKKILVPDSLNLPQSTSIMDALDILPELLERPGDFLLSNYDLQIEDMSVGDAADVMLRNLQIADIEKIEITESPMASFKKNGQGGTINFILRSKGQEHERTWGSVGLNAEKPNDFGTQLVLGHKSSKSMIRGLFMGELFNCSSDKMEHVFTQDKLSKTTTSTDAETFNTQMAMMYYTYKPNQRDKLALNLSESYSYTDEYSMGQFLEDTKVTGIQKTTVISSHLEYKHTAPRSSFLIFANYDYKPSSSEGQEGQSKTSSRDTYTHGLSGKAEYSSQLLSAEQKNKLNLVVGLTYNLSFNRDKYNDPKHDFSLDTDYNTYYFTPYAKLDATLGKVKMRGVIEYQSFNYKTTMEGNSYSNNSNDLTGRFITEWYHSPSHILRLIMDRKLSRPSYQQLYPYLMQPLASTYYQKGNPDLKPIISNEIKLDYIGKYSWDNHSIQYNAGLSYNYVKNIITSYTVNNNQPDTKVLGATLVYKSFKNDGINKITNANLMVQYSNPLFSIAVTGNLYYNDRQIDGISSHQTYYNLQVYPYFNLKNGWNGGVQITYFSKIRNTNSTIGDCGLAYMSVGKNWGPFHAFIYQQVNFSEHNEDISDLSADSYMLTNYHLIPNQIGLGFKYFF